MFSKVNPVKEAYFKQQYRNRPTIKLYAEPLSDLPEHLRTLIDIVYNNSIPVGSILPANVEKHLIQTGEHSYSVAYSKDHAIYDTKILVDNNISQSKIVIYVDKDDMLDERIYKTVHKQVENNFVDTALTKADYFTNAGRTTKSKNIQYSDDLAVGYKILFNIIYYVGTDLTNTTIEELSNQLYTLLDNSEVTLSLSVNQTAMVYGTVDDNHIVTLHVREVGTPDTFYTRTFALSSLY